MPAGEGAEVLGRNGCFRARNEGGGRKPIHQIHRTLDQFFNNLNGHAGHHQQYCKIHPPWAGCTYLYPCEMSPGQLSQVGVDGGVLAFLVLQDESTRWFGLPRDAGEMHLLEDVRMRV